MSLFFLFFFPAEKLILSFWKLEINYTGNHCGQDIKPRFHSSRFHGSEDGEDDVCGFLVTNEILSQCSLLNGL